MLIPLFHLSGSLLLHLFKHLLFGSSLGALSFAFADQAREWLNDYEAKIEDNYKGYKANQLPANLVSGVGVRYEISEQAEIVGAD